MLLYFLQNKEGMELAAAIIVSPVFGFHIHKNYMHPQAKKGPNTFNGEEISSPAPLYEKNCSD